MLINDGVVGEAVSGNLINLFESSYNKKIPEKVAEQYNEKFMKDAIKGKKIRRLKIVVRQVNYARELLCKSYLVNQGQLEFKDSEIKKLLVQFGREKISSAKKGMIIEQSPRKLEKAMNCELLNTLDRGHRHSGLYVASTWDTSLY